MFKKEVTTTAFIELMFVANALEEKGFKSPGT
jgi:hypothetical protein